MFVTGPADPYCVLAGRVCNGARGSVLRASGAASFENRPVNEAAKDRIVQREHLDGGVRWRKLGEYAEPVAHEELPRRVQGDKIPFDVKGELL